MSKKQKFELKEDHLKLLAEMWVDTLDGQPILDRKRPFGNSYIERDVIEIIDFDRYETIVNDFDGELEDVDLERARKLIGELHMAMSVVFQFGHNLGTYERALYGNAWEAK